MQRKADGIRLKKYKIKCAYVHLGTRIIEIRSLNNCLRLLFVTVVDMIILITITRTDDKSYASLD